MKVKDLPLAQRIEVGEKLHKMGVPMNQLSDWEIPDPETE